MAASGTTKNITVNQLLGAGGTATLASATITGDLTVRTNQLIVNSSGVGVGTTPSAWSGIGPAIQVEQASLLSESSNQLYLTANGYFAGGQWNYINNASADQYYQIAGSHVWRNGTGGSPGTAIGWSTLMTLNSTGLGVGVASPSAKLHIDGNLKINGATSEILMATGAERTISASGSASSTVLTFKRWNGVSYVSDVVMDGSGNVGIGVTPAGTGGCLQLKSGVTFPATQVASADANTLDDYEEGTWTIGLTFGGGSTGITTNANIGRYTKIGRQVTVIGLFSLTSKGSSTGIAEITGLPFTIPNGDQAYSAANVRFNGISFADVPICIGATNSTKIILQEITNAGVVTDITDADFTNSSQCIISFTYTV
jgi:hypothetical protein